VPQLTIVPMRGWRRDMEWNETGLIWIPTSPHIPEPATAARYVVTGFLGELAQVSIGVGYTMPFAAVAHPDWDGFALAQHLNRRDLDGVFFRPLAFKAFYGGFKDKVCRGVQYHVTDASRVNLAGLAMVLIEESQRQMSGKLFSGAKPDAVAMFDKVSGGDAVRKHFEAGKPAAELIASWEPGLLEFRKKREPYLLPLYSAAEKKE
jgi:uncharacterized protein YbbC (DUF1343 family)